MAATLAHADDLIGQVSDLVLAYSHDGETFRLENVRSGDVVATVIAAVKPLPRAIALYAADALTTLRAAIEHALYAELEHANGGPLSSAQARSVEMPAQVTAEGFDRWVRDRQKRAPSGLQPGAPVLARVRGLQPYQRGGSPEEHPLRVLVEHTNLAKHRMPAITATRVGRLLPDFRVEGMVVTPTTGEPARAGDALASVPYGQYVPITIYPAVGIQRPHTRAWPVLVHELVWLAEWTRTVAVPVLVTGTREVDELPPTYDTSVGHDDERLAIVSGPTEGARERAQRTLMATLARTSLPEILELHPDQPSRDLLDRWVASLDDQAVVDRLEQLQPARDVAGAMQTARIAGQLVDEAYAWARGHADPLDPI